MPIDLRCSSCNQRLRAKDALAGKSLHCPVCKSVVAVPASKPAPKPAPPPGQPFPPTIPPSQQAALAAKVPPGAGPWG